MKLHQNKKLFKEAIEATAQLKGIPAIYIEKDYWVTYALYLIFKDEIGKETIFKGGTALSKCFDLIHRFSEDIDLVIMRSDGETDNQLKKKIKRISKVVENDMPERQVDGLTVKMGMNRKTAHDFKKIFKGEYGQIRRSIILEATWLGYYEPFTQKEVSTFIYQMMVSRDQKALATKNDLLPFKVNVLEPIRTFCEKIMSLVRFSYSENPLTDLKLKIRHTYDLHMMLKDSQIKSFLESKDFSELLLKVGQDDVKSFRNNNKWLENHPKESYFFKELDTVWTELENTFSGDFRNLVYADSFPRSGNVLNSLKEIGARLEPIGWDIKIEE
jgi:hypothetical protein